MSNFNIDQYLNNRAANSSDGASKTDALLRARAQKAEQLVAANDQITVNLSDYQGAWTKKLNIEPDSFSGEVVNLGANVVSGATRLVGDIASTPFDIQSMVDDFKLEKPATEAYARATAGTATPEDLALLKTPDQDGMSPIDRIRRGNSSRKTAAGIDSATDFSSIVEGSNKKRLSDQLEAGFDTPWNQIKSGYNGVRGGALLDGGVDMVAGLAKLVQHAGSTAANNPLGTAEFVAENAPQLAVGMLGKTGAAVQAVSNAGYGLENYRQGVLAYQKENNGALPPEETRAYMAKMAVAAAAAEHLGDMGQLKAMTPMARAAKAIAAGEEITRTGFKAALLNIGKATAAGTGEEALTEGFQTFAEGEAKLAPAQAKDIYTGATIGGLTGGVMSGAGRMAAEVAQATPEHAAVRVKEADKKATFDDAVKNNDTTLYADQAAAGYDPSKAISVLHENSKLADTPIEQRSQNFKDAQDVYIGHTQKAEAVSALTPDGKVKLKASLTEAKHDLAALDPKDEATAPKREKLAAEVTRLKELVALPLATGPDLVKATMDYTTLLNQETALSEQLMSFSQENKKRRAADGEADAATQLKAAVESAKAVITPEDVEGATASTAAAQQVLVLSMAAPDSLSSADALSLVQNTANGLTDPQRDYLRSLSEGQMARNKLMNVKGVSDHVLYGDTPKGMVGIAMYQARMGMAVEAGNEVLAARQIKGLSSFLASHTSKAAAVAEALSAAKKLVATTGNNQGLQVVRLADGSWEAQPLTMSKAELDKNGGLRIHPGSGNIVAQIANEAAALTATLTEFKQVKAMKFGGVAAKVAAPVAEVLPQAPISQVQGTSQEPAWVSAPDESTSTTKPRAPAPVVAEVTPAEVITPTAAKPETGGAPTAEVTKETGTPGIARLSAKVAARIDEIASKEDYSSLDTAEKALKFLKLAKQRLVEITSPGNGTRSPAVHALTKLFSEDSDLDVFVSEPDDFRSLPKVEQERLKDAATSLKSGSITVAPTAEVTPISTTQDLVLEAVLPSVPAQVEQSTVKVAPLSGQLESTKNGEAERAKPYQQRNLVASNFDQVAQGPKDSIPRPLVAVKNLMSQLRNKTLQFADVLGKQGAEELDNSPKQQAVLQKFSDTAAKWDGRIKDSLVKFVKPANAKWSEGTKAEDFYFQDMMQFMQQSVTTHDGGKTSQDLEENLRTAMSYAAFSWIGENGSRSQFNDKKEINRILRRDEKSQLGEAAKSHLANAGVRQNVLANTLGQRAFQALGMKFRDDAPQGDRGRAEAALGLHIIKMLMTPDPKNPGAPAILKRESISNSTMQALMRDEAPFQNPILKMDQKRMTPAQKLEYAAAVKEQEQAHHFVSFNRDEGGRLAPEAQEILEASKSTHGVLDRMFTGQAVVSEPSFKPIPFAQRMVKKSKRVVASKLEKILRKENEVASYVRPDVWNVMTGLTEEQQLELVGGAPSDKFTHVANVKPNQAKIDALQRDLTSMMGYIQDTVFPSENGLDQPLYFEHTVMKQQRVHITTKLINPQGSKVQRWMLFRKAWETQVDPTNSDQVDNFKLRVMEGLGVKTDKQSNTVSLAGYAAMFHPGKVAAGPDHGKQQDKARAFNLAVQALVARSNGADLTLQQQQYILAGVKAGGAKMHSLDALLAVAERTRSAAIDKNAPFTVRLMGEIDGVTNGPMLAHLLMGAASSVKALQGFLNKGGFFEQGSGHKNYNVYRGSPGVEDLYESTMTATLVGVSAVVQKSKKPLLVKKTLEAIYTFTGQLAENGKIVKAGRNFIKTPLTAFVFGSSTYKAVDSMADAFIEQIYAKFEDVARDSKPLKPLIDELNWLMFSAGQPWSTGMPYDQVLKRELTGDQIKAIKQSFHSSLGAAVKETLGTKFADFETRRNAMNLAAKTAFHLYNSIYQGIREEYVAKLVATGKIKVTGGKVPKPIHDLTAVQERELQRRLKDFEPIMHTLMSKDSGDLDAGITVGKTERQLSDNPTYAGQVKFGTAFPGSTNKSAEVAGMEETGVAPGVAMAIFGTHSSDSAISHNAGEDAEVLNVHDAHGTGLATFLKTAQNLNAATWDTMLRYSPLSEMGDTLERTITGLTKVMSTRALPSGVITRFHTAMKDDLIAGQDGVATPEDVDVGVFLQEVLTNIKEQALEADTIRLGTLAHLEFLDQYALEGGQYTVTEKDRGAAEDGLKELKPGVAPQLLEQAAQLGQMFSLAGIKVGNAVGDAEFTKKELDDYFASMEGEIVITPDPVHIVAPLLEQVAQDPDVATKTRNVAQQALGLVVSGEAKSLNDALTKVKGGTATSVVSAVANAQEKVPAHLWNAVGTPAMASESWLVELLSQKDAHAWLDVIKPLYAHLVSGPQTPATEFQQQLLKALRKDALEGLTIRYVTPATHYSTMLSVPQGKSRGWYAAKDTTQEIYVLSPDFVHSGLTVETLIHEMVHASVARTIAAEQAAKKASTTYTSPALELVNDLETLLSKAKAKVNELSKGTSPTNAELAAKLSEFTHAVGDVQELVAWGMSNEAFQKEVLTQVSMQSKTKGNPLVQGMKSFIDALVGLVFRGSDKISQAKTVNGMTILVSNVSGLMAQAAKTRSPAEIVLSQAAPDPATQTYRYNTQQIFEALDSSMGPNPVSPGFKQHLNELLSDITYHLHGAFGIFHRELQPNQALTPMDVWTKTMDTGEAPFASTVAASPFQTSAQELFVIEQMEVAVREVLENKEAHVTVAYNELARLYMEARSTLKPADFASQDHYDFLFKVEQGADKKSAYLSRFVAMGLAHQEFNQVLSTVADRIVTRRSDMTWTERLQSVFNSVLTWLNGKITKSTPGEPMNVSMQRLVGQLVDTEAKKRRKLMMASPTSKIVTVVEDQATAFVDAIKMKAMDLAKSDFVQKSGSGLVKGVAGVTRIVVGDHVDRIMDAMQQLRNQHMKQNHGWVTGLINEVRGVPATVQALVRMAKKNEQDRKRDITDVAKSVKSSFKERGDKLSQLEQKSITNVFLRTGMHTLLEGRTMTGLQTLIEQPVVRDAAIQAEIGKLNQHPDLVHYFVRQAKTLAYFKATGKVKGKVLLLNAGNIARLFTTGRTSSLTDAQTLAAEQAIDRLISLYALKYTPDGQVTTAKEVLRSEMNRADGGNGVEMVLKTHARLEQESRERLFGGSEALMTKGYTPEIYNPHTSIMVARTPNEHQALLDQGYTPGKLLELDPDDPDQQQGMLYVLKDGGLLPRVTGAISAKGMSAKGSRVGSGDASFFDLDGMLGAGQGGGITANRLATMDELFRASPSWEPVGVKGVFMAPVLTRNGEVASWRYLMHDAAKDVLLERDNRFDQVLGAMAGSIVDKETTATQNSEVIKALKEIHSADYATKPLSFVRISHDSANPEMREIYRLLPDVTQREIEVVWGKEGMFVPYELLHPIFGYRKWSLSSAIDKQTRNRQADREGESRHKADEINPVEQLINTAMERMLYGIARGKGMDEAKAETYSRRGSVLLRRAENYWQTVVQLTKDIIVVKTISVMLNNIQENVAMLVLQGVSPKALIRDHIVAIKGALDFQRDRDQLAQLQLKLNAGYTRGDEVEIQAQIHILEDAIARNPVKELIDAGLLPTIAEDVDNTDDLYSYKPGFHRKVEELASKVNPQVLEVAKQLFMTHDTSSYKLLSRVNNLADFVGKYVLYQHLTSRKENPLSKADAVQRASDVFVNYDIPMHPSMQYLDDHGFMMFTKYFLRIQRVLMKLTREHPMRVLMATLLKRYFAGMPMPMESAMIYRVGNNPLSNGAFKFTGVVDETAPIQALSLLM